METMSINLHCLDEALLDACFLPFCTPCDVFRLCLTCKSFFRIFARNSVWLQLLQRIFSDFPTLESMIDMDSNLQKSLTVSTQEEIKTPYAMRLFAKMESIPLKQKLCLLVDFKPWKARHCLKKSFFQGIPIENSCWIDELLKVSGFFPKFKLRWF